MNNMTKDGAPLKAGIIYSDGARDSARMTWLIEEAHAGRQHLDATVKREYARQYIDLMMAQTPPAETNADAERARWCEEIRADVMYLHFTGEWHVTWIDDGRLERVSDPDRNTAIDKALAVVK
jgi:hypothetical protein